MFANWTQLAKERRDDINLGGHFNAQVHFNAAPDNMNVFIDTNIFLSFYHYTSDDLDELRKIRFLLDSEALALWIPNQVVDEFDRNRERKIADALTKLRAQSLKLQFPEVCKDFEEYNRLRDLQRQYSKSHSELISKITDQTSKHSLKADSTIDSLFQSGQRITIDSGIIDAALERVELGNPPGKKGSTGDAVNWESLLQSAPSGDLFFVSDDKDYCSPIDENQFNSFLLREWNKRKGGDIIFYKKLSSFFRDHFEGIELSSEAEKDMLIQALATSPGFETTHKVVGKLQRLAEFTPSQASDILDAIASNNQVYWIIGDSDITEFTSSILKNYGEVVPEQLSGTVSALLEEELERQNAHAQMVASAPDDDLPF